MEKEKTFRKIEYMRKDAINLTGSNASFNAKQIIESAKPEEVLALRITINSPVYIEAASKLTPEGIREICKD